MLYRYGIVIRFERSNGVIARSVGAGHKMRAALDIRYRDFRIRYRSSGRIEYNARDAAGADLRVRARRRQDEQRETEEDAGKKPMAEDFPVFVHNSPLF